MEVKKIYFDMDDTIADFSRGLIEICGLEPISQDKSTPEQDDAMWAAVRDAGDFYYRLEECTPGMDFLKTLRSIYGSKVEILTAIPKAKRGIVSAEYDKRRWVAEHIDDKMVVNIAYSADEKKQLAGDGCFLVDDLKKNIDSWREAGGIGIWFLKDDEDSTQAQIDDSKLLIEDYMCCIFSENSPEAAMKKLHWAKVEEYGSFAHGHSLHTWDSGERFLARCSSCEKLLLIQDSEYSDPFTWKDDDYRDIYPVKSVEEAEEINKQYDGFSLERELARRALFIWNGKPLWHEKR